MMRTLDQVDAEQLWSKTECSARELREYEKLDFVIPVNEFAKRPKCKAQIDSLCKQLNGDTIGRGFSITVFGCVCHRCLYPKLRAKFVTHNHAFGRNTGSIFATVKRNRWDGYVRPSHNCECGKPIAEKRAKHCPSCAAKQREAKRRNAPTS